jgi:hypothetical protein
MLRAIAFFWAIVACVGCNAVGATEDPSELRDRLEHALCRSKTLDEAIRALQREKMEHFLDREKTILTAKKVFNPERLFSSAVVIEIRIDGDKVRQCKVQVLHTGP